MQGRVVQLNSKPREGRARGIPKRAVSQLTITPVERKMVNLSASSGRLSGTPSDGRKKKSQANAERTVVTKPGPRPPYRALMATATRKKKKMLSSIKGLKSPISPSAMTLSATARTYQRWMAATDRR